MLDTPIYIKVSPSIFEFKGVSNSEIFLNIKFKFVISSNIYDIGSI